MTPTVLASLKYAWPVVGGTGHVEFLSEALAARREGFQLSEAEVKQIGGRFSYHCEKVYPRLGPDILRKADEKVEQRRQEHDAKVSLKLGAGNLYERRKNLLKEPFETPIADAQRQHVDLDSKDGGVMPAEIHAGESLKKPINARDLNADSSTPLNIRPAK